MPRVVIATSLTPAKPDTNATTSGQIAAQSRVVAGQAHLARAARDHQLQQIVHLLGLRNLACPRYWGVSWRGGSRRCSDGGRGANSGHPSLGLPSVLPVCGWWRRPPTFAVTATSHIVHEIGRKGSAGDCAKSAASIGRQADANARPVRAAARPHGSGPATAAAAGAAAGEPSARRQRTDELSAVDTATRSAGSFIHCLSSGRTRRGRRVDQILDRHGGRAPHEAARIGRQPFEDVEPPLQRERRRSAR